MSLDPELATKHLIELANERGGEDNISVAVLQIGEQPVDVEADPAPQSLSSDEQFERIVQSQAYFWIYPAVVAGVQIVLIVLVWKLVNG